MAIEDIYNCIAVDAMTFTAGQPTEEQLQEAAASGIQTVINLATISPRYSLADEQKSCQTLNMAYIHIPVEWDAPKVTDYRRFESAMQDLSGQKVLIHCAANYRVSAFFSVFARKHLGWSRDQAVKFRDQIWKSDPKWTMDEKWESLLNKIDPEV